MKIEEFFKEYTNIYSIVPFGFRMFANALFQS